jgi:hypothetical protein
MRVGVIPELHSRVEPELEERHASRVFAPALEESSLVHETDSGSGAKTEMLEDRFRPEANLLDWENGRGYEREVIDGDRDMAHRLAAERGDYQE